MHSIIEQKWVDGSAKNAKKSSKIIFEGLLRSQCLKIRKSLPFTIFASKINILGQFWRENSNIKGETFFVI